MARPKLKQGSQKIAISATIDPLILDKAIGLNAAKSKSRSAVIEMALIKLIECEAAFNNLLKAQSNG